MSKMRFAPLRGWIPNGPQDGLGIWGVFSHRPKLPSTPVTIVPGHEPVAWMIEWECGHRRFTDDFSRVGHYDGGACPKMCPNGEYARHVPLYGEADG